MTTDSQVKNKIKLAICLIVFCSILSYANSLQGDFIWDDWGLITTNEFIKSWDYLALNLSGGFFDQAQSSQVVANQGYYRPVITLSYMLDYSLWELNPIGYRITNLLWHAAVGIIIYLFVLALFKESKLALFTSLLFVAHPIHTESVSWIAGRTDIICGFFFFAALYLYCLVNLKSGEKRKLFLVLSLLAFVVGLYAKEMAVTLPLVLIAIDYFGCADRKEFRERIKHWLPYWIVLFCYLVVRVVMVGGSGGNNSSVESLNIVYVLLTFGRALIYYLQKLIYPVQLSAYVLIDIVDKGLPFDVLVAVTVFVASALFVCLKKKQYRKISFAVVFFWISLAPISNIVPLSGPLNMEFYVAERFLYIPSFAFCLLIAILLGKLTLIEFKKIKLETFAFGCFLLFYAGGTIHANSFWKDGTTLFTRELSNSPQSFDIALLLGQAYVRQEDCDKAVPYFLKASQLGPKFAEPHTWLGFCYYKNGKIAEAITENKKALLYDEFSIDTRLNLAKCYLRIGKSKQAISELLQIVKINPKHEIAIAALNKLMKRNHK